MKINIEEIKKAPDKKVEINFSDSIEEFKHKEKIKAALVASASKFGLSIKGKIMGELILECDRCLSEYVHELNAEINEDFITDSLVSEDQKEYELGGSDFVEELNGQDEIDIKDLVYQSIILDLPYKCLCKADCPGSEELQKLNKEEYIDERLEVFKSFSENSKTSEK